MEHYVKERRYPSPGSILDVLDMLRSEVRSYQEIPPTIGLRVPACYEAEVGPVGIRLVLEDLSTWAEGADPTAVAALLGGLHRRFEGQPSGRCPWLRPVGAAADLIGARYDQCWSAIDTPDRTCPTTSGAWHAISTDELRRSSAAKQATDPS